MLFTQIHNIRNNPEVKLLIVSCVRNGRIPDDFHIDNQDQHGGNCECRGHIRRCLEISKHICDIKDYSQRIILLPICKLCISFNSKKRTLPSHVPVVWCRIYPVPQEVNLMHKKDPTVLSHLCEPGMQLCWFDAHSFTSGKHQRWLVYWRNKSDIVHRNKIELLQVSSTKEWYNT